VICGILIFEKELQYQEETQEILSCRTSSVLSSVQNSDGMAGPSIHTCNKTIKKVFFSQLFFFFWKADNHVQSRTLPSWSAKPRKHWKSFTKAV